MKKFIVYHVQSTMERCSYKVEGAARRKVEELNEDRPGAYAYTEQVRYLTEVVHMVTRRNLMSGQEYQEPSNTPGYMSPASEAYWSM